MYAAEVPENIGQLQDDVITTPSVITVTLDLVNDNPERFQELLADIPETFFVQELACTTDVFIEGSEKDYVLGFTKGSMITRQNLLHVATCFKMKNKFSTMALTLTPQGEGFAVTLDLVGLWTFNKLIVRGILRGAEKYRQCYLLEFGEVFDKDKHQHSIEKIKESFRAEGFFNGKVHDYLQYDNKTKHITVTLVLDTGYQFKINDVVMAIKNSDDDVTIQPLLKKLTLSFVPRLKNFYYSQTLVNNETNFLKSYVSKKGYLNSVITLKKEFDFEHDTIKLFFSITLHQKKAIAFFGNHFFSNKELYDLIFAFGRSTALLPDSFLCQEIIDAYQKKGFWQVEVNCKQEQKRTYFLIKEGQRITIDSLDFIGNDSFSSKTLKGFFSTFKKTAFDEESLRHVLQKMVNFYLKEGFIDVKVVKQDYIPAQKPGTYTLVITINEGERRYFKSATVDQFPDLALLGPFAAANKEPAVPFDVNQIQVQRQWLMHHFQQQGYLYVDAKPEITYEETKVAVFWKISGNEQKVTFGKTIVLGSHTFPFENIVRELPFKEGDIWQKEKLEQALKQLRRLGIFESIYLYPYNITQQEDQKAIIIKLLEDDPFEVRVRAGFQQVSKTLLEFRRGTTYKLGGTLLYKNPFNAGDCFCIDTDFTRFYRNVSVQYARPWFFSMPLNMVVKGYSNKYIQPVFIGSDKPLYQAIQQGFLISVNRCCYHLNFGCNVGLEVMETNDLSIEMARAINFITTLIDKKVPYLYIEPNLVIDYLNNDVNPSHGTLTVVSCKAMTPLRSISTTYLKFLFEQVAFLPVPLISSVLGLRFKIGHIFNQEFSNIMPPDRYYLGGQNSLRSYEPDKGPPLGSFIEKNGRRVLVPQGGRTMFNMNVELRFPLLWNIGGVVFQDLGFLAQNSLTEVIRSHLLAGTGFGLRYYTPVGPLRFDIGWKWRKFAPEESRYAWFLTLGHAF
jgi:outer membrane protein insertion porin family